MVMDLGRLCRSKFEKNPEITVRKKINKGKNNFNLLGLLG